MPVERQLPQYQSHKKVWALKIKKLYHNESPEQESYGLLMMVPEEDGFAPIALDDEFVRKHSPKVGGYWVQYEGGYTSFSPADAFEGGYSLITKE
jgi:hypothetical protein